MKAGRYTQIKGMVQNRLPKNLANYRLLVNYIISQVAAKGALSIQKQIAVIKEFTNAAKKLETKLYPLVDTD
jgi:Holliday junction resolvase RusA-like endonuclease